MNAAREDSPVTLAIDLGGTNLRLALVSRDGTIVARSKYPTCATGRPAFLDALRAAIDDLLGIARQRSRAVIGVGAGVPGLVNHSGQLLAAVNLPFLDNINVSELLQSITGLPTVTVNDANAAAVGEFRFGAGQPFTSLLLFTLGTGVGSGLILNGSLWSGADGIASEFGHATVEPEGFACPCGNRGCLEQYTSASALLAEARRRLAAGETSSLSRIDGERLTAADVGEAANTGDPLARQLLARSGRYLGQAAAVAANLLNLEAFVLTGGMAESYRFIAPAMEEELKSRAFPAVTERIRIVQGSLGDDAGLLGVAALAWERA